MALYILISSGGTGGHMSPASALAQDLRARGHRVELATDERGLKFAAMFQDMAIHKVASGTVGAGMKGKIKGMMNLMRGFVQAFALVRRMRPDVVVGFGGYPSVPSVLMAQILGLPTLIHEQNGVLGLANRILAPRALKIALSLPLEKNVYAEKSVVVGNPVRPEITALHGVKYAAPKTDMRVLVLGGSLGASVFSSVVPKAVSLMKESARARLEIVQQVRAGEMERVQKAYADLGVRVRLAPFFEAMAGELAAAHLIICRSGASTVAEVSVAGIPAVFVPYPHHKDQQQKKNAQGIVAAGGAWMMQEGVDFTPEALWRRLEDVINNPMILQEMAGKAKGFAKPMAAKTLGDLVESVVKTG